MTDAAAGRFWRAALSAPRRDFLLNRNILWTFSLFRGILLVGAAVLQRSRTLRRRRGQERFFRLTETKTRFYDNLLFSLVSPK